MVELEAGVREALDAVHALGAQDGLEHLIVVRDGREAGRAQGTDSEVSFSGVGIRPGDIVVHNHPNSLNALSNVDASQIFFTPIRAMYAISRDKSVYKVEVGEKGLVNPMRFLDVTSDTSTVITILAQARMLRSVSIEDMDGHGLGQGHWINKMMALSGVLKYTYELQPETKKVVEEIDQALGFDKLERLLPLV